MTGCAGRSKAAVPLHSAVRLCLTVERFIKISGGYASIRGAASMNVKVARR